MPFGFKRAVLRFLSFVTEIFRELIKSGNVAVYLDDFLIAATIEHHFAILKEFCLLIENKSQLRIDKYRFLQIRVFRFC